MRRLQIQNLELKGKKVLLRVDFNVPLNQDGSIADDTRLRESVPTIDHILKSGGSVILMSHLGRPKGIDPKCWLCSCAAALSTLLRKPVLMAEDCIGDKVESMARALKSGDVLLLENLRFHSAEEKPETDPSFAEKLARLGDVYVDDAFGAAHREHSSITSIARYFPGKAAAGLLMQKEIDFLQPLPISPKRPFYAIIGGAKISTKIGVLGALLSKVDKLFIGGGMAYTFYKAQGISIGDSIHEDDHLSVAKTFLKEYPAKMFLPSDVVIADNTKTDHKTVSISGGIPEGWQGMDIGPKTRQEWKEALRDAATIFWNGPLGVFEEPTFAKGTEAIAHALAVLSATTIVGGGDSIAAIHKMGLGAQFTHLSTGGGASLEFLESGHLPGIDALSEVDR